VQETLSQDPRSSFFKLFQAMNYTGEAVHMAELLGAAFIVEVFHRPSRDGKKVYANLKGPGGYNVKGTTVQDRVTGKPVVVDVPPALTEPRAFIWDIADLGDWYSIYIPGEWAEQRDSTTGEVIRPAASKNVLQERIAAARNWSQHPLAAVAKFGGDPRRPPPEELERLQREELERQQREELKARQEEIRRHSNAALDAARAKYLKESKRKKGPRKGRSA
jgi:hypothetical protein